MSLSFCPKCGKFNAFNASKCSDCGASLEGEDRPKPGRIAELWSLWTEKCVQELWCIVIGIILILLGIFVPELGSGIIQIVLIFTTDDRYLRRSIESDKPSAADSWWVIAVGLVSIGFGAFGLYAAWEKSKRKMDQNPQPQNDTRPEN